MNNVKFIIIKHPNQKISKQSKLTLKGRIENFEFFFLKCSSFGDRNFYNYEKNFSIFITKSSIKY